MNEVIGMKNTDFIFAPEMRSHIQMPKCVLKRFEDQQHRFSYYDVVKGFIGTKGRADSLNTELGFYSTIIEQFLNDNIETPFGDLLKTAEAISIDPPSGSISPEFDYTAKRFVYALIARDPKNITRFQSISQFSMLPLQQQHDFGVIAGFALEVERDLLANHVTTIAVNDSQIPFILPRCGIYYNTIHDYEHLIMPVSPQRAIVFVEPAGKHIVAENGMVHPYSFDETDVKKCNSLAFSSQCKHGNGFVVSVNRDALEEALYSVLQSQSS